MVALTRIEAKVQEFLEELKSPLVLELSKSLQSGKMLRSKLALTIAGDSKECVHLCAIIEMIQSASLLHDDVIDEATTRRNKPSVNALFGDKNAIMLGDVLYSKAFSELTSFAINYPQIPRIVANAVTTLAIGEMEDVVLSSAFNADEAKYLAMIEHKTAALIEATAYAAAFLAGKDEENAKRFQIYGRNLGVAFQIIDDVLDIISDSKTLGKPTLNDFKEGKTTLPYLYLYHILDEVGKVRLRNAFGKDLSVDEQEWILGELHTSGAIKKSVELAKHLGRVGVEAITNQSCDKLAEIMRTMIERDF
ncbi:polyprenyl synthetase family protein [Helicobacter turcicus]|uniref:Polyprenyl synthetase family protein n=1 Tax=Helicobacter turcicus TaxID=2867412 RepID=A0ABS7JMX8_9HELI|nr:polyprenyl synthetase family protein [Helicobacter turcicus]MBX7490756.1 polyprenyl synthetase family protein [Helicobacter turcicus]MBX7545635.1 polyprenyl synthetase family protein [Helicobacter turcicus]